MEEALVTEFSRIVGSGGVVTDIAAVASYLKEERGLFFGKSSLVLRPSSTAQVAAIMQLASQSRTPIVPQGGNTGLVGGQIPHESGGAVLLLLERLNGIREIDPAGQWVIVEAGVILQNLQEVAAENGRLFPLSLAAEGRCQIGGNLSSNAGGTAVLAYGNMRELCLGLEVVLPDGRVLDDFCFVKKNNSGYDLKNLFIGAEGTLGIITAAALKLFPRPQGRATAFIGLGSVQDAEGLFAFAQERAAFSLTGFELISNTALEMACAYGSGVRSPLSGQHAWYVLLEISSHQSQIEAQNALEDIIFKAFTSQTVEDAVLAQSLAQCQAFWRLREVISPAQKQAGASIKHDISLPIASIPVFISKAAHVVETLAPGARIVCFGHMGDGNLHYNVSQPVGSDAASFLALWSKMTHEIHNLALAYRGSFSAEHGIGQLKRQDLLAFKSPVYVDIMRALKQVFDPLGIMNPGKML